MTHNVYDEEASSGLVIYSKDSEYPSVNFSVFFQPGSDRISGK